VKTVAAIVCAASRAVNCAVASGEVVRIFEAAGAAEIMVEHVPEAVLMSQMEPIDRTTSK